jgi:hypothetical protein
MRSPTAPAPAKASGMSDDLGAPARRRSRLLLALLAAISVGVLVLAALGVAALLRSEDPAAAPPAAATPSTAEFQDEIIWVDVAGVRLPVSRTHGPRVTADGLASGFARSPEGAALAAAHVLIRTGPTVGPDVFEPTITTQVTGPNVGAMKLLVDEQYEELRRAADTPSGDPVPGADAEVVGYRVAAFDGDEGSASVEIVLGSPELQAAAHYVQFTVALDWQNNDWWVVAPPQGDWGTVSTHLSSPPADLLDFGGID